MNGEKKKTTKEKILELMDNADKNSAAYQQVKKAMVGRDLAMVSINELLNVEDKYYLKVSAQLTDKSLLMEEIVEACLSFQQISPTSELNKLFFDFLMEPTEKRMTKLKELSGADVNTLNHENLALAKKQKEQLDLEIIKVCVDLQDGLTSSEVANHVLDKSIELVSPSKKAFIPSLTIPVKHIYEVPEGSWYRGMIVDSFFEINQINKIDKSKRTYDRERLSKFWLFLEFLSKEQHLPKLLQRADLSEIEKKIYIHAAVTQSHSSLSGDDIAYFRKNVHKNNSPEIAKQIAEKEIVYLIAKEVNTNTAITLDEMLRGNRKKTADIMAKLYAEVPLTIVKEYIRNQVETSFDPDEKLVFYKKSVLQKLEQEKFPGVGSELYAVLDPNVPILTKLDQFEKIYTAFESPESKQQYDYPESKELLAALRKCLFGDSERKVETILLIKQEAPDEKMNMPELLEKNIEDLENLRISSGLRTINAKIPVHAERDEEKGLQLEKLADTMFKLKAHLSNWDDKIQKQVKKQLMPHLKEEEKNQVVEIFNEKEAVHQIFAVSPELEKKWQKILVTPNTTNMKSMVDELKSRLGEDFLLLLKDNKSPVTKKTNEYYKGEEKTDDMVTDLIKMKIGENIYRITKELEYFRHKAKDVSDLRTELINASHKVQNTLNNVLIFVRKNRDQKTCIEKQFFDELCKSEVIQNFIKQDPKLKSVLYECQKLAPLNENDQWSKLKDSYRMNRAFTYIWWYKYWNTFEKSLNASISEKQYRISELNQGIVELWKRDGKLCKDVVYAILKDSAGVRVNLQTSYVGDFRDKLTREQKNRRKAQNVMDSYVRLKSHNKTEIAWAKLAEVSLTTEKAPTKQESLQQPLRLGDKIRNTGAVPKTNNQAVTRQPAALKIITGKAVELQSQINDSKKEATENNQRKQEIEK